MADVRDEKLAKLIGRNISNLLLKRGKSQKDLCDNLGFSPASVSSWVNGTRIPKEGNIVLMASYLDCSVDDIALDPKEAHRKRSFSIPVYARVGAGPPLEASEEIIDREEISERMASLGSFYGLRIDGDSMEPRIVRGDVVIVRKQDTADTDAGTSKKVEKI